MTTPKYQIPRSKVVAAKKDSPSLKTTIPEKIAHSMRLKAGDAIEWIWITEGFESYVKLKKVTE